MPPPTEAEPVRVERGSLHELLAVDRRGAGEVRRAQSTRQLSTVAYSMPLHVQWRRALRRHRRLRVMAWSAGLAIVAGLMLWQAPFLGTQARLVMQHARGAMQHARGAMDHARGAMEHARGAVDWAKGAAGMVHGLWLRELASDELRATEQAPTP